MARRRAIAIAAPSRFPTEFLFRLLRLLLILAVVAAVVLAGAGGVLTYRIMSAQDETENVTPSSYLLSNFENLGFKDRAGAEHDGWLLLGLKGAPTIILCHGYNSNRSELLPLGIALRENHFNVYLFNFHASKGKQPFNNLGVQQADQLLAAIETVTKQPVVNQRRVGLFGMTSGGYAAFVAAAQSPRVKAVVGDSIYENPDQIFDAQLDGLLGGSSPLFRALAEAEFHLFSYGPKPPRLHESLPKLERRPKLFISGRDQALLAAATEDLYNLASQPKRLLVLERSEAGLAAESEKKEYENQVLSFFLQNLPLRAD